MGRNRLPSDWRPTSFPEIGELFDNRYQLETILGSGGGSAVFKALDTRLNRQVAIKVLAPNEMDAQGVERFRREALSIARLTHPSIVTIHDFNEAGNMPYLVLELVSGVDLWRLIYEQERRLSAEESVQICINILDALAYAHENGIIHRDLKPENVMVIDEELNVKVTDFGLAYMRGQNRITREGVIAGSAYYMAPEVANGAPSDQRSDLYALGVMMYELLTGRLPFYSENPLAVISQHLYDAPIPPSEIRPNMSPVLEAIVLKLLSKKPEDRFASAQQVLDVLTDMEPGQLQPDQLSEQTLLDRIDRAKPAGRDAEWGYLRDCWQQVQFRALDARPVVLIDGEAGSGKNQLAHQLIVEARLSGAKVLSTQCFMTATPLPYEPIIELLRQYLRNTTVSIHPVIAADLAKLVPEIAEEYELEALPAVSPDVERLRLYEHVTQFLIDSAQQQPLLLLIEYIHSSDASTLSLLHYLARNINGHPIMILGTYRPSELDHRHPLDMVLRELISQDLVERITLRRLIPQEVHDFIKSIFGSRVAEALGQIIYEKTHGNIFFIKEILKSLVLDGHVYANQNDWSVKAVDAMELPSSIRSVIGHLLSKLSDTALEILSVAAVIGHEFSYKMLAAVTDLQEDALWNVLEESLSAKVINEKRDTREEVFAFENLAIHQTLLERLNHRTKARLHLKIAKALESLYPRQIEDNIEIIARHYSLGARTDEDIDIAIRYLERAADRASHIFALMTALDLYNHALDLAQDDVSPEREQRILNLRERRGLVHHQVADFDAAAADLEAVLQSLEIHQDNARKRTVLLQLGQVYRRSEQFHQAIKTLTEAVELSRTLNDETLVADALYFLGATYWSLGEINDAIRHQEEAYGIITRLGLEDEIAMRVLHGLAECCMRSANYPMLFTLAEQSLRLARRLNDLEYQSENLVILGAAEVDRGNYERAEAHLEEDYTVCERAGLRWHRIANQSNYGLAKASSGDYETGLRMLKDAYEFAQPRFKGILLTMVLNNLGRCYLDLEALPQAEETLSTSLERSRRHGVSWSDAASKAYWSMAQIRQGNLEVGTLLEEALEQNTAKGDLRHVPFVYRALAELEIARENPAEALAWAEQMHTLAQRIDQPVQVVQADRWRAEALMRMGRYEEAQNLLEAAVEVAVNIKSPRLMWDLHSVLAEVYDYVDQAAKAARCRMRVRNVIQDLAENVTDSAIRRELKTRIKSYTEAHTLTTTLRLLVISDAFGTVVQEAIKEHLEGVKRCDAVIVLGDLPSRAYPLIREIVGSDIRGLCVLGNHDDESYTQWLPRYNFEYLHTVLATLRIGGQDITFGGFSGSERYKTGDNLQWSDAEASRAIKDLPGCDILLTHTAAAPPPGYEADRNHRGLPAIDEYIQHHKPRVALHGHFHQNYQYLQDETLIIGCFGAVLVQCMITDEKWQIEVQPLLNFG